MVVLLCNHDGQLKLSQFGEDTPALGGVESLGGTEGTGSPILPLRVYFHALLAGRKILADVWAWKRKLKVRERALRRLIGDPCPGSGRRPPLKIDPMEGPV